MKHCLSLILLIGICFGKNTNPCEDERFLKIKKKSLDAMSEREYAYFLKMEKKCDDLTIDTVGKADDLKVDSDLCNRAIEVAKSDKQRKWFWLGLAYGVGVPLSYFSEPTPSNPSVLNNLNNEEIATFLECYKVEAKIHSTISAWKGCGTLLLIAAIASGSSDESTTIGRIF